MGHAKKQLEALTAAPALHVLPPPVALAVAPASKKPKLDLDGFAEAAPKGSGPKTYTTATGTDPALVSSLLTDKKQAKELEESIKRDTALLMRIVGPQLHQLAAGKSDDTHSILIAGEGDDLGLVSMTKRYSSGEKVTEAGIIAAIGQEAFDAYFDVPVDIVLALAKVPDDQQQPLINAIRKVATELGCGHAFTMKRHTPAPKPGFHATRRIALDVDTNIRLDGAIPLVCSTRRKTGAID